VNIAEVQDLAGDVVEKARKYFPQAFRRLADDEIADLKSASARLLRRSFTSLRYMDSQPIIEEFGYDWRAIKYLIVDRLDDEGQRNEMTRILDFVGDSLVLILGAAPPLLLAYFFGGDQNPAGNPVTTPQDSHS
jgi:hypothetical protein